MIEFVNHINDCGTFIRFLNDKLKSRLKKAEGTMLILIGTDCPWSLSWLEKTCQELSNKTSKERPARIIFLSNPESISMLLKINPLEKKYFFDKWAEMITQHTLKSWDDQALSSWLTDVGFGPMNELEGRQTIKNFTGNWSAVLHELGARCREQPHKWEETLNELHKDLGKIPQWREAAGLNEKLIRTLKGIAEWGQPISIEDAIEITDGAVHYDDLEHAILWCDYLNYAYRAPDDKWAIDKAIQKMILG
jgi:hypothetical protein